MNWSLLFTSICLLPISVIAKNNADSIKFEMIKETVNFYLTDENPILNIPSDKLATKVTCDNGDYTCLYTFSDYVKGAKRKVETWRHEKTASKEDLIKLKTNILEDVTNTKQGKSYRKTLASYAPYEAKLELLVSVFRQAEPEVVFASTSSHEQALNLAIQQTQAEPMENNLPLIALIISCIAILLSAITYFKKTPKAEGQPRKGDVEAFALEADLNSLKRNIEVTKKNFDKELQKIQQNLSNRITELENKPPTITWTDVGGSVGSMNPEANSPDASVKFAPETTISYAKYPDRENGFSSSILRSTQNGEQTYEIEISGDRATYAVSSDEKAQKYALFNFEYLSSACEFHNKLEADSKIYTLEKGTLIASSGNWIIQSKAVIQFR